MTALICLLAAVESGWLAFDGWHALTRGDYVTPRSGRFAGQLGPWSRLVRAVGIDPRARGMMWAHLLMGTAGLAAMMAFAVGWSVGWVALFCCAVLQMWYLPFGTLLSVAQMVLLLMAR